MGLPVQRVIGFPLSASAEQERNLGVESKAAWLQPRRSMLSEELLACAALEAEEGAYSDSDSDYESENEETESEESSEACSSSQEGAGMHVDAGRPHGERSFKRKPSQPLAIPTSEASAYRRAKEADYRREMLRQREMILQQQLVQQHQAMLAAQAQRAAAGQQQNRQQAC